MPEAIVRCSQCGTYADPDASDYTLIGAAHGWRVIKREAHRLPDGGEKLELEWLCPDCWRDRKKSRP